MIASKYGVRLFIVLHIPLKVILFNHFLHKQIFSSSINNPANDILGYILVVFDVRYQQEVATAQRKK